jgi:hypothetical protein
MIFKPRRTLLYQAKPMKGLQNNLNRFPKCLSFVKSKQFWLGKWHQFCEKVPQVAPNCEKSTSSGSKWYQVLCKIESFV